MGGIYFQAAFQYTTKMERRRLVAIFQIKKYLILMKFKYLATSRRRSIWCS